MFRRTDCGGNCVGFPGRRDESRNSGGCCISGDSGNLPVWSEEGASIEQIRGIESRISFEILSEKQEILDFTGEKYYNRNDAACRMSRRMATVDIQGGKLSALIKVQETGGCFL